MRIGFYGMPTSGKTYLLNQIDFMEVIVGSKLLRQYDPDFDKRDYAGREADRSAVANILLSKPDFIMDGHYAFGDEIAFTPEEGKMYDVYLYLFVDPEVLKARMEESPRNSKYLKYDISAWQDKEIKELRKYCHEHNKDFYVIDNPPSNTFQDVNIVIDFIRCIREGYSCVAYAKSCANTILSRSVSSVITLLDGDKTLTIEDTSNRCFGYKTHIYDGNFYTGFQAWRQDIEFRQYSVPALTEIPVRLNERVLQQLNQDSYILTSGHEKIWSFISEQLGIPFFCGTQMSAETKYYITKFLQSHGKSVVAFGDGMNDYYMLKQANTGYLIGKQDGSYSRSLKDQDLEGLIHV